MLDVGLYLSKPSLFQSLFINMIVTSHLGYVHAVEGGCLVREGLVGEVHHLLRDVHPGEGVVHRDCLGVKGTVS
jgi:hypothetical protein